MLFWHDFAADSAHSVPVADRFYAKEYAKLDHMRAGFESLRLLSRMPKTLRSFQKLRSPCQSWFYRVKKSGASSWLIRVKWWIRMWEGVVETGSDDWLMEEAPDKVIPLLVKSPSQSPFHVSNT